MVSVAVSKSGKTDAHFIDKGIKVDGAYYGIRRHLAEGMPVARHQTTDSTGRTNDDNAIFPLCF
jgi:hypothetical protein